MILKSDTIKYETLKKLYSLFVLVGQRGGGRRLLLEVLGPGLRSLGLGGQRDHLLFDRVHPVKSVAGFRSAHQASGQGRTATMLDLYIRREREGNHWLT